MFILFCIFILILMTSCNSESKMPAFDEQITEIIQKHQVESEELDLLSLPVKEIEYSGDIPKGKTYQLPHNRRVEDAFVYTIIWDQELEEYYVLKEGGFAGIRELYGPGKIR